MKFFFELIIIYLLLLTNINSIEIKINKLGDLKKLGDAVTKELNKKKGKDSKKEKIENEVKENNSTEKTSNKSEKKINYSIDLKYCGFKAFDNSQTMIEPRLVNNFNTSLPNILSSGKYYSKGPFLKTDYINITSLETNKIEIQSYFDQNLMSKEVFEIQNSKTNILKILINESRVEKEKIKEENKEFRVINLKKNIFYDFNEKYQTTFNEFANKWTKRGPYVSYPTILKCASNEEDQKIAKKYFDKIVNNRLALKNKIKKEKEEDEERQKQEEEELKKVNDFNNSPEGMLLLAYKRYIVLEKYYEGRKGFQLIYINKNQFEKIKNLTRDIDTYFSKKLNKDKMDQLWARASKEQSELYSSVNFSAWDNNNKQYVSVFIKQLEELHKKILGSKIQEKTF